MVQGVWRGLLWGLLLGLAGAVQADQRLTFSVPYAANLDMSAAKLADMLASPDVRVSISYEPGLGIPLWTSHLGYCTGHRICFKKAWETLELKGEQIRRGPDSISIVLPDHHWFGGIRYHLAGPVRVVLPALWPGEQAGNVDFDLAAPGLPQRPVFINLHLPVPYVGIGEVRLAPLAGETPQEPSGLAPCDPVLVYENDRPAARESALAQAYVDWLRRLADSDWWTDQIPDARFERLTDAPPALTATVKGRVDTRRVTVNRGDVHLLHIRTRYDFTDENGCKHTTQQDYSWLNGELLAAGRSDGTDIFSGDSCPAVNNVQDALWWKGHLLSYYGPRGSQGESRQWTAWKLALPECLSEDSPTSTPVTGSLPADAAMWKTLSDSRPAQAPLKPPVVP